jgi:hypothetical protein
MRMICSPLTLLPHHSHYCTPLLCPSSHPPILPPSHPPALPFSHPLRTSTSTRRWRRPRQRWWLIYYTHYTLSTILTTDQGRGDGSYTTLAIHYTHYPLYSVLTVCCRSWQRMPPFVGSWRTGWAWTRRWCLRCGETIASGRWRSVG